MEHLERSSHLVTEDSRTLVKLESSARGGRMRGSVRGCSRFLPRGTFNIC